MPMYDYKCEACGLEFEKNRKVEDRENATCPACGAQATKTVTKKIAFVLKGSGWSTTGLGR